MVNPNNILNQIKNFFNFNNPKFSKEEKKDIKFLKKTLSSWSNYSLEESDQRKIVDRILSLSDNVMLNYPGNLNYVNMYLNHNSSDIYTLTFKPDPNYKKHEPVYEKYAYFIELLYKNGLTEYFEKQISEEYFQIHLLSKIKDIDIKKEYTNIYLQQFIVNNKDETKRYKNGYLILLDDLNPDLELHKNKLFYSAVKLFINYSEFINPFMLSPSFFKNKDIFEQTLKSNITFNDSFSNIDIFLKKIFLEYQNNSLTDIEFRNIISIINNEVGNKDEFIEYISHSKFDVISLSAFKILNEESPNIYNKIKESISFYIVRKPELFPEYKSILQYILKQEKPLKHSKENRFINELVQIFIFNDNHSGLCFLESLFENNEEFIKSLQYNFIFSNIQSISISKSAVDDIDKNIDLITSFISKRLDKIDDKELALLFLISFNDFLMICPSFKQFKLSSTDTVYNRDRYNEYKPILWNMSETCKIIFSADMKNMDILKHMQVSDNIQHMLFDYLEVFKPKFLEGINIKETSLKMNIIDIYFLYEKDLLDNTFKMDNKSVTNKRRL